MVILQGRQTFPKPSFGQSPDPSAELSIQEGTDSYNMYGGAALMALQLPKHAVLPCFPQ